MINEATIRQATYFPELLPDARTASFGAGELSPPLLELRRLQRFVRLVNLCVERNASVKLYLRWDEKRREINTAGLLDRLPDKSAEYLATDYLYFNVYGSTSIADYRVSFGLYVTEPTVAEKLAANKPLTPEEQEIAARLGISATAEKGLLPLSRYYTYLREYCDPREREPFVYSDSVGTTEAVVGILSAEPGRFLALEGIAASPGTVAENVRIRIDRDNDSNYLEIPTYPLSLDWDLECFVPALHELRVKVVAASDTTTTVRYRVGSYRLTNLLRVRFGLLRKDEAPGDVWEKVKGGVL
jgi:hypothetical protein